MSSLRPAYALALGDLRTTTDRPVGGPVAIEVWRSLDGADALTVELAERRGVSPGDAASVELGVDGTSQVVFTGAVVAVAPTLAGVRIVALGALDRLLRLRVGRAWQDRSAGAIVRDLAEAAGVEVAVADDGPTLPRFAVDARRSAAAHLRGLAERLGYALWTGRDGRLNFSALGAAARLDAAGGGLLGAAAGVATAGLATLGIGGGGGTGYTVGQNVIAARGEQRLVAVTRLEIGGEGPASQYGDQSSWWLSHEDDQSHGSAGSGDDAVRLVFDATARTKDLADRIAAGTLATAQRGTRRLGLTGLGRAGVELGDEVQLGGAADAALNAKGYVRGLRHRLSAARGYTTELDLEVEA